MAYTFKHGDRPLDDFTIQRAVGRGGFGEVYYAISDGGREVALKYLRDNPEIELRGVAACMNLKSPHLITIFDVKRNADGDYFIVMEYVSGPSLRDLLIAEPNGIGPQKAAFFLREMGKGLAYLHDRGIVHRDMKPGNIFYDEGYVKIGDYGLSKFMSVSRHSAQTASVGTVHYMAPEVGSGNYHRGIDIYALGVILYEMLLGKVPFEGSSMGEVLMKHLTEQPEVKALPAPFGKIVHKALHKDPAERYQTIYELTDDLMGVEDVRMSLAGFNPASLGDVARHPDAAGAPSPVPSPNPVPTMSYIPRKKTPANADIRLDARDLPPKLAKQAKKTHDKVEKRIRKLEAKYGPRKGQAPAADAESPRGAQSPSAHDHGPPLSRGEYLQRGVLALAMAIGLGLCVGFLVGGEGPIISAALMTVGVSAGIGLGCRAVRWFSGSGHHPRWVERLCFTIPAAAVSFVAVVPMSEDPYSYHGSSDEAFLGVLALLGAIFFVNWRIRIEGGAAGELSIKRAAMMGILAAILTAMFTEGEEELMLFFGGVGAAISLVVQAMAWLFPLERWLEGKAAPLFANARAMGEASAVAGPTAEAPGEQAYGEPARGGWFRRRRGQSVFGPAAASAPVGDEDDAYWDRHRAAFLVETHHPVTGQPRRWAITRIFGAMLALASLVGACAAVTYLSSAYTYLNITEVDGLIETRYVQRSLTSDEALPAWIAVAGGVGMMFFGLRKMTRFRTGPWWRDTGRPLAIAVLLAAITAMIATIQAGGSPGDRTEFKITLAVATLAFVAVLTRRGRRQAPGWPADLATDEPAPVIDGAIVDPAAT